MGGLEDLSGGWCARQRRLRAGPDARLAHGFTLPLLCASTSTNACRWCRPEHTVTNKTSAPHSGAEFGDLRLLKGVLNSVGFADEVVSPTATASHIGSLENAGANKRTQIGKPINARFQ